MKTLIVKRKKKILHLQNKLFKIKVKNKKLMNKKNKIFYLYQKLFYKMMIT